MAVAVASKLAHLRPADDFSSHDTLELGQYLRTPSPGNGVQIGRRSARVIPADFGVLSGSK